MVYRLLDPGSEWRLHRLWFEQTAMADLLGADYALVEKNARYHGAPDGVADVADVRIPFVNVMPGTYLVRVQVDGAEGVLTTNVSGVFVTSSVQIV